MDKKIEDQVILYLDKMNKQNQEDIKKYLGVLNEVHQENLKAMGEMFEINKIQLDRIEETLGSHSKILDSHTKILDSHTQILNSHSQKLDSHTEMIGQLIVDVSEIKETLNEKLDKSEFILFKEKLVV